MPASQNARAILWMLGGMFSLLFVSVVGKLLAPFYNTFEIMLYRSIIGFGGYVMILLILGRMRTIKLERIGLHVIRNLLHFSAQNLWFYALGALPLAIVISFEFSTPAWVIILAALFMREGFGWRRFLVIALSMIGVLLIANPAGGGLGRQEMPSWPIVAALLCAIGFGATMIATKALTRSQNIHEILLMMTALQAVFSLIIIILLGRLAPIEPELLPHLILMGVFGTSSHYCITAALTLAESQLVAPIDLLRLPLSIFAGMFFFGESAGVMVLVGAIILVLANWVNIRRGKTGPTGN